MTSARQSDANGALITGEELSRMPDHELCELIDGRIVQMSPTKPEHGRIEANIARLIGGFASAKNWFTGPRHTVQDLDTEIGSPPAYPEAP